MTRVLVVEDDPQLVRALVLNLRARRYGVDSAADGATALSLAAARQPDAVILDLGLPDMDGTDVIRGLRGWSRVPILVLSARRASDEKVAALDAGADDYITKPFSMDELLARLRAAVRRTDAAPLAPDIVRVTTDEFTIDLAAKKASRGGRDIRLTPTEWHLLEILVTNPGRLITQKHLLQEVWGESRSDKTNYLRVYMAQLRRKLETDPAHPRHLITEPGMGYRFEG
ncbi:response regulator [Streptomyces sp. NPDC046821]|uniref:response regulator n=1 Tax=Streptomyces sp. NPDC046821 TaxID=3154702 RepID=UPI0033EBBAC2